MKIKTEWSDSSCLGS